MTELTFARLREANTDRLWDIHRQEPWSPNDWAVAAAGELEELCNLLKKRRRGEAINRDDLCDELADTVIYLDLLAACLGIDLGESVRSKFNIVSDRYGVEVKL